MARFFADDIQGERVVFRVDAGHIARTLRLRRGDTVIAMDGNGQQAEAVLDHVGADEVVASARRWTAAHGEPTIRTTVYQGLCRGERFETVVQKTTELGVYAVVPLMLKRCEVKPADMDKRLPRLQKIAREAAKQSGRGRIPRVHATAHLRDADFSAHDLLLCPFEMQRERGLRAALTANGGACDIGIVIGPEGGFEADEIDYLQGCGAHIVTLGPRVLRTETASPAVLAVVMAHFGQWEGGAGCE
jgi:16S rRNA (uracil1498-N3)-methyltransferase